MESDCPPYCVKVDKRGAASTMTEGRNTSAIHAAPITKRLRPRLADHKTVRLRIGVIGYGYWGPQLVRNMDRLPFGQVTYMAELSAERRWLRSSNIPRRWSSITSTRCWRAMSMPSSSPRRFERITRLARAALEQGKHVFVEKPLTANSAEARDLIDLADVNGLRAHGRPHLHVQSRRRSGCASSCAAASWGRSTTSTRCART